MLGTFSKNSLAAIAACAFSGLIAGNVSAETLTGAVEKVLSGHPKAKAAKAAADIAHYEAMEIRGSLLPHLNVGGSIGPSYRDRDVSGLVDSGDWLDESRGSVSVRQRLFQRGLALNDTRAAKRRAETARLMAVDVDQQLALLVIEAYLGILRGQEQVQMARENVGHHVETLNKTQARKDAGRATQADVELVKARLGLARSSVETRKVLLENAKVRYRALVEEEPKNLQTVGRLGSKIPSKAADADITGNPALMAAKENYEAAKYQKEAAKGLLWPLFELDLGGGVGNDVGGVRGQDDEAHAFLVASWDVWEGGARRAQKKQREKREDEALNIALDAQLEVEEALGSAIADRNGALLTEKQLRNYATAIGQVVGSYQKQVEVGSRAMLNLLDVQNEDFRANSALVDSEFASLMAGYRVITATGRLVEVVAPNAANGDVNNGDVNDGGGKNVVPMPAPDAQWIEPADEAAPMIAVEEIDATETPEAPKKKGLFSRMFGGKKAGKQSYEAYDASPAVLEDTGTPAPTAVKGKDYSWSAASPNKIKGKKAGSIPAPVTPAEVKKETPAPVAVVEEVSAPVAVETVEITESIEVNPEPKKKRKGFFKFLKPGGTIKSAKPAVSEEVITGEVDEVVQND